MRAIHTAVLLGLTACSILFVFGYVRTIYWLHIVRSDPRILIVFEPSAVAFFDYECEGRRGFQFDPYFPPAFDLPEDSVQLFRVPCWLVALPAIGTVFYSGLLLSRGVRRRWANQRAPGKCGFASLFQVGRLWPALPERHR